MNRYGYGLFDGTKSIKNRRYDLFTKKIAAAHLIALSHFPPCFNAVTIFNLQVSGHTP
jgi:hypothetical protein